jgi:hypothetical protein
MSSFYTLPTINSERDALHFFHQAVKYRKQHPDESQQIATFVYDTTHEMTLGFSLDTAVDLLRGEFIALEAPGLPPDDSIMSLDEYDTTLWVRLERMISDEIKKRTV